MRVIRDQKSEVRAKANLCADKLAKAEVPASAVESTTGAPSANGESNTTVVQ